jgi:hypothetical protein
MGYGMLWLATLASALGLAAVLLATATRRSTAGGQRLVAFFSLAGMLLPGAVGLLLSGMVRFLPGWFAAVLSWNLALGFGVGVMAWRAFRVRDVAPAGRAWPRVWLLAGFGVFAVLSAMTFWTIDRAVLNRMHTLRTEAGAMALAATAPRVPDHQNAAPLYQDAFESLDAFRRRSPELKERIDAWFDETTSETLKDAELGRVLTRVAGDLRLLRRAAAMPGCHFEHNAESLYAILLPELAAFRDAARWMALEGRHAAARGDLDAAVRNAAAISRMAGHCAQEPFLISGLVAVAMEGISSDLLDATLASRPAPPADAAPWADLPPISYRMVLQRALRMEMAAGLETYSQLAEGTFSLEALVGEAPSLGLFMPFWRVFFLEADLAFYRQYLQQGANRLSEPYGRQAENQGTMTPPMEAHVLSALMMPDLSKIGEHAALADAQRRLARVAVAVAAYRAAEGAYPARLEDLLPKFAERIPLDPFDDQPLRLVKRGDGVAVYSIGADRKDNGGKTGEKKDDNQPADLVIRIGTGS